jgi:hypothetical protein
VGWLSKSTLLLEALFMPVGAKKTTYQRWLLGAYFALTLTTFRAPASTSHQNSGCIKMHYYGAFTT